MSYCTARRVTLESKVRQLQGAVWRAREHAVSKAELDILLQKLADAQAELATVGDCGD